MSTVVGGKLNTSSDGNAHSATFRGAGAMDYQEMTEFAPASPGSYWDYDRPEIPPFPITTDPVTPTPKPPSDTGTIDTSIVPSGPGQIVAAGMEMYPKPQVTAKLGTSTTVDIVYTPTTTTNKRGTFRIMNANLATIKGITSANGDCYTATVTPKAKGTTQIRYTSMGTGKTISSDLVITEGLSDEEIINAYTGIESRQLASGNGRFASYYAPDLRGVIVSSYNLKLLKILDEGRTWNESQTTPNTGGSNLGFYDPFTGVHAFFGCGKIVTSSDSTVSWVLSTFPKEFYLDAVFVDSVTGEWVLVGGDADTAFVLRSSTKGALFSTAEFSPDGGNISCACEYPEADGYVILCDYGGAYLFKRNGTVEKLPLQIPIGIRACCYCASSHSVVAFTSLQASSLGTVCRITSNAGTWNATETPVALAYPNTIHYDSNLGVPVVGCTGRINILSSEGDRIITTIEADVSPTTSCYDPIMKRSYFFKGSSTNSTENVAWWTVQSAG